MPAANAKLRDDHPNAADRRLAPPRSPAERPRGAARREALLEAVLRIVAEVGADAVTHRRVASVAGLPLASTTYWFRSKEHLLTAALEHAAKRDIARLQSYLAGPVGDADPVDTAVGAILDPLDEGLQASRGSLVATYALLLEAARRPALRAVARGWTDAYLDALGRLLALAGSGQPRADAELLLSAADGLLIEQLASGSAADLAPRLRRLAVALLETA
jgi:TetR/AcrR family transcriptional regulator, regulator of biofilm formation and stress response